MSNCPKCNAVLPEGTAFCSSCGAQINNVNVAPQAPINKVGKLHCPNCKSHNISISTESSVNSAITASHGRSGRISTTSVSTTHRNYWFCSDCGTKFRNIQNLEEEIGKAKYTHFILWGIGAILAILFFRLLLNASDNVLGFLFIPYIVGTFVGGLVFTIMGFVSKSKLGKMKSELAYLKENCFN